MKIKYINIKTQEHGIETVDHFPANTREERAYLKEMLHEYRLSYQGTGIVPYLSQQCSYDYHKKE